MADGADPGPGTWTALHARTRPAHLRDAVASTRQVRKQGSERGTGSSPGPWTRTSCLEPLPRESPVSKPRWLRAGGERGAEAEWVRALTLWGEPAWGREGLWVPRVCVSFLGSPEQSTAKLAA